MFSPHFDIICDILSLDRPTATWNPRSALHNKETKNVKDVINISVHQLIINKNQSKSQNTVRPLYHGHLGDSRKVAVEYLTQSKYIKKPEAEQKRKNVAVVERWPL